MSCVSLQQPCYVCHKRSLHCIACNVRDTAFEHMQAVGSTARHFAFTRYAAGSTFAENHPCFQQIPQWQWKMLFQRVCADVTLQCDTHAGFERFNSLDRARYYHEEMVKAGLAPKAMPLGQDGSLHPLGMAYPDLSALKHQVCPPLWAQGLVMSLVCIQVILGIQACNDVCAMLCAVRTDRVKLLWCYSKAC